MHVIIIDFTFNKHAVQVSKVEKITKMYIWVCVAYDAQTDYDIICHLLV